MTTRRKYDWPSLLKAFSQSNQSQAAFCKEHNINPKYFNQKLNKAKRKQDNGFSKVEVAATVHSEIQGLVLHVGSVKIHYPHTMPLQS